MPSVGPDKIIVILIVALVVLGPEKLPEAARRAARALVEVRRWSEGVQSELRGVLEPEPPTIEVPASPETEPSETKNSKSRAEALSFSDPEVRAHRRLRPPWQFPEAQTFT